jgi:hypothetical protein
MKSKISLAKVLLFILSLALGAFFIFSAYTKTIPIGYFEYTISSQLHVTHRLAAIAARFFIGLEAALGLLMLISVYGRRKWILKICLGLLIVFSLHLLILWITRGNDVNCGCMGNIAPMSPAVSILKNIGLIIGVLILIKFGRAESGILHDILGAFLILLLITVPFFVFPVKDQLTLPLSKLYQLKEDKPTMELRKGKHVLCLMSLTCRHCRHAAGIIHQMRAKNPALPFYFIFPHADNDSLELLELNDFMHETKDQAIPHSFLEYKSFVKLLRTAGEDGVPAIFWMQDSTVVRKISIPELNQKELEQWLKQ